LNTATTPQEAPDRRGFALIMVLWVLTVLALIAASFAQSTRTDINLARNLVDSAKAEALAEAGVYQAITGLSGRRGDEIWRVDGTVYAWLFGGGEVRVTIEDEGGKIDLNAARDELLRNLFRSLEADDEPILELTEADALVDAILDFRDEDSLRHFNGAEDADYRSAGLPYDSKDDAFELVEELQQVLGITRDIYDKFAPALTVYSRRRRPFSTTASEAVQTALDSGPGEAIGRDQEAVPEGEEADSDGGLDESDVVAIEELTETPQIIFLGPSSARSRVQVYTIHAEGQLPSGAVYALEAVTRITRNRERPFIFEAWRRADRKLFVSDSEEEDEELSE
jgi:general secretion pathway protein K